MENKRHRKPSFQPISFLPHFAVLVDGRVKDFEMLKPDLGRAQREPHLLDERTVNRLHTVHVESLELADPFDAQLERWAKEEGLTSAQRSEVARLQRQVDRYREECRAIIALAESLKKETIETILRKSDHEVALGAQFADRI